MVKILHYKALEMYLLTVNNEESLIFQFTNSNLSEENEEEFEILQNDNIIIGKYLLSLFYYKDIILSGYVINLNFAKKGDSRAQCGLGNCYYDGEGTDKNYKKAFEWYSKSANSGCAEGQHGLGNCYYYGKGTKQNYKKAFEWYSKSANSGYAAGQCGLGNCYNYGKGTKLDYKKAFEWYSKSANGGCVESQFGLGNCYYYEKGVMLDYKKAFEWYYK